MPPPEPNVGVVKFSTSVASAESSGTLSESTVFLPVGSVPTTESTRCPGTAAKLARTSVSVRPETSSVPFVAVAADACA